MASYRAREVSSSDDWVTEDEGASSAEVEYEDDDGYYYAASGEPGGPERRVLLEQEVLLSSTSKDITSRDTSRSHSNSFHAARARRRMRGLSNSSSDDSTDNGTDGEEDNTQDCTSVFRDATLNLEDVTDEGVDDANAKKCWICLEVCTDPGEWVQPCRCRGTLQGCHQACLQHWLDMQQSEQRGDKDAPSCPMCKVEYVLSHAPQSPMVNTVMRAYEIWDASSYFLSTLFCVSVGVGSIYTAATAYGAMSLCHVVGWSHGSRLIQHMGVKSSMVVLPLIPMSLLMRLHVGGFVRTGRMEFEVSICGLADALGFVPLVAGAGRLLLPAKLGNPFQRSLLSGIVCVTAKDMCVRYCERLRRRQKLTRRVLNYVTLDPAAVPSHDNTPSSSTAVTT